MKSLEKLYFDNSYTRLPESFYSKVKPHAFNASYLISYNTKALDLLDLDHKEALKIEFLQYFSGQKHLPGTNPIAMLYAGHQFGQYVKQLGDGRAILLGEVINKNKERWDLHVKGSGRTPYSRAFDGRAVLRSSIREYLACEAMYNLGIPSTRALCLIGTGETVIREKPEKGALIVRLAPTHVRFGSFEAFYYRNQFDEVKILTDYSITNCYPHLLNEPNKYILFFQEVVDRTAKLVAKWMAYGFAHGVLNSDNMSILGITIDYGPFGFMDAYNPNFIPNFSDKSGRYSYINQPYIVLWNLTALAESLQPVIPFNESSKILDNYSRIYLKEYYRIMRLKLGLVQEKEIDKVLIQDLLSLLEKDKIDYTIFFRKLSNLANDRMQLDKMLTSKEEWTIWLRKYHARITQENGLQKEVVCLMRQFNPKYIPRNYILEECIRKVNFEDDYSEIGILLSLFENPYKEQDQFENYANLPPDWSKTLFVSCSS
jgi:uncharacterized protein YdiU (UPF0061 family)